LKLLTLQTLH